MATHGMIRVLLLTGVLAVFTACTENKPAAPPPPPQEISSEAVGHYCGMTLHDHTGPKGQIHLKSRAAPVWFSSVRDTVAFTMLPEEAKDITAIYVNDLAIARNWEQPEAGAWVEARRAWFVVGSRRSGGMGGGEAFPFSTESAAQAFTREHGGKVLRFAELTPDFVFGSETDSLPAGR